MVCKGAENVMLRELTVLEIGTSHYILSYTGGMSKPT